MIKNVVICAHFDDEVIGCSSLLNEETLVIVVCSNDKARKNIFLYLNKLYNFEYVFLNFMPFFLQYVKTDVFNKQISDILEKYPNTIQSYFSDEYPFACDFYIPELNLYIEYNGFTTHCGHFFNSDNENDLKQLEELKYLEEHAKTQKSKNFYKNIIYTWTILDKKKQDTAENNKLNYVVFWNEKEANDYIRDIL